MTIWRAIHSKLVTWKKLRSLGYHGPSQCSLCKNAEEDMKYLFITCPFLSPLHSLLSSTFSFNMNSDFDLDVFILQAVDRKAWSKMSMLGGLHSLLISGTFGG